MHRHLTKFLFMGTLLVLVAAVACGESTTPAPSTAGTDAEPTATNVEATADDAAVTDEVAVQVDVEGDVTGDIFDVEIVNFQHPDITVELGTTVQWTNEDQAPHTVTSGAPGDQTDLFDTRNLGNKGTFSFTFDDEGEFPYFCRIHPTMIATVKVVASVSSAEAMEADDATAMETSGEAMTEEAMADDAKEKEDGVAMMVDEDDASMGSMDGDAVDVMEKEDGDVMAMEDGEAMTDDAMAMEAMDKEDGDAMAMEDAMAMDGDAMSAGGHVHPSPIADFKLETVTIEVGTTIEWKNDDQVGHTSTFGVPGEADAGDLWDSGSLIADLTFSHTFSEEGEFVYFCRFHPSMRGTITVVGAGEVFGGGDAMMTDPDEGVMEPEPTAVPEPEAEPVTISSDIKNFQLESLTVEVGTTVTWVNRDAVPHTATSGAPQSPNGIFDTPFLNLDDGASFTFNETGEFAFYCRVHPSMTGTITVADNS